MGSDSCNGTFIPSRAPTATLDAQALSKLVRGTTAERIGRREHLDKILQDNRDRGGRQRPNSVGTNRSHSNGTCGGDSNDEYYVPPPLHQGRRTGSHNQNRNAREHEERISKILVRKMRHQDVFRTTARGFVLVGNIRNWIRSRTDLRESQFNTPGLWGKR